MSVSIIVPTYNRRRFETLLEYNINSQTYYNIKEIIILDDSDIDRPLCIRTLIPIRYYTVPRCTIGMKRNFGVKLAHGEYIAFMDDDDFYHPDYISHSIFVSIIFSKLFCKKGTASLLFTSPNPLHIDFLKTSVASFNRSKNIQRCLNHLSSVYIYISALPAIDLLLYSISKIE